MLVRDALAGALIERLDIDFVDPSKAEVTNESPASITYGVAAIPATGSGAAQFKADFASMMAAFITANIAPTSAVLIIPATLALQLMLMQNALGQREFPDITLTGGTVLGIPTIVSEYLTSIGSPGTGMIVLVNASDVYLADDGQVVIDISREASLQMTDGDTTTQSSGGVASPSAPVATTVVSMWQTNSIAIRAERWIRWKLRRAQACQYISSAAYSA
jgi:hypothetical protein